MEKNSFPSIFRQWLFAYEIERPFTFSYSSSGKNYKVEISKILLTVTMSK